MADENTEIQEQTQEATPQQQSIQFEDILPWGTTGGDTGLSSRLKLKRNFEKIKAWMDSIALHLNFDDKYLSKTKDDEAAGLITFAKGLISTLTASFGDYQRTPAHGGDAEEDSGAAILPDGTGDFINLIVRAMVRGNLTVEDLLTAKDIIFKNELKGEDARRGFTDGKGIYMNAKEGLIETEGLNVRGFMRVMELIINRLQLMESDYSFTEGDTVDHIDYEDGGQTLVLTMHKDHDNDYTPFYPGDIVYGIVNDLLPQGSAVPDGHTPTRNGSYYHTWMRVKSVDVSKNQLRVTLYDGQTNAGVAIVPGGYNFSPKGTQITTDMVESMYEEYYTHIDEEDPTSPILGETGYDTMLTITRHGNIADGIDPATGEYDEHIHQSQMERQQAWVLSTTDKRLSFFWNVDSPIIHDENYALCLGILPDLANLPSTRNRAMPSLYVNTVFADHYDKANYPARVIKEDRGQWTAQPSAIYTGQYSGTYVPDGTINADDPELEEYAAYITVINSYAGSYTSGDSIPDPYHFRTFNMNAWLTHRLDTAHNRSRTDKELLLKMLLEWRESVDLEVSRVWNDGALWECLVDGTTQEPWFGNSDWQLVSGGTFSLGFYDSSTPPAPIYGLSVRSKHVNETVVPYLLFGQEDISEFVTSWKWERRSNYPALDEVWKNSVRVDPEDPESPLKSSTRELHIVYDDGGQHNDLPDSWDDNGGRVAFICIATFFGDDAEITNTINII